MANTVEDAVKNRSVWKNMERGTAWFRKHARSTARTIARELAQDANQGKNITDGLTTLDEVQKIIKKTN